MPITLVSQDYYPSQSIAFSGLYERWTAWLVAASKMQKYRGACTLHCCVALLSITCLQANTQNHNNFPTKSLFLNRRSFACEISCGLVLHRQRLFVILTCLNVNKIGPYTHACIIFRILLSTTWNSTFKLLGPVLDVELFTCGI